MVKKISVIEKIIIGWSIQRAMFAKDPCSIKNLVSLGNQANGIKMLYEKKKIKMNKQRYEMVKEAYEKIMSILSVEINVETGENLLSYIPPKRDYKFYEASQKTKNLHSYENY